MLTFSHTHVSRKSPLRLSERHTSLRLSELRKAGIHHQIGLPRRSRRFSLAYGIGSEISTSVPAPRLLHTRTFAPMLAALSCIPVRPRPVRSASGSNAGAVITNDHAQLARQIFNFRLHPARCGVPQGVQERFPCNPINLLLNRGYEGSSPAMDDDAHAAPAAPGAKSSRRRHRQRPSSCFRRFRFEG